MSYLDGSSEFEELEEDSLAPLSLSSSAQSSLVSSSLSTFLFDSAVASWCSASLRNTCCVTVGWWSAGSSRSKSRLLNSDNASASESSKERSATSGTGSILLLATTAVLVFSTGSTFSLADTFRAFFSTIKLDGKAVDSAVALRFMAALVFLAAALARPEGRLGRRAGGVAFANDLAGPLLKEYRPLDVDVADGGALLMKTAEKATANPGRQTAAGGFTRS